MLAKVIKIEKKETEDEKGGSTKYTTTLETEDESIIKITSTNKKHQIGDTLEITEKIKQETLTK